MCAAAHTTGHGCDKLCHRRAGFAFHLTRQGKFEVAMTAHAIAAPPSPRQNHLLAALHAAEYDRLLPDLEGVPMPLGEVLYESGGQLQHIYFPTTSVVSLLCVMKDGESAEIAIAGNEGLVGIALIMGGQTTPSRAVVQCAGRAYRMLPAALTKEFDRGGAMQRLMLRYMQALITQMVQTAACNRHHSVEQQFCRWLLLSIDRLPSNELTMTEGLIANMLGVRQEGVTDRKSTRLNSSHVEISYAVFCLKKKT